MIKTHAGATPLRPVFCAGLDQKLLYISLLEQASALSQELEFLDADA
jgi:hypothetical protein